VQELRVKAFRYRCSLWAYRSGTINMIMKTGTNFYSCSVYEFTQPSVLGANHVLQ